MRVHRPLVMVATALMTACAASPAKIQPAMVSGAPYKDMPCASLEKQLDAEISILETLSGQQIADRSWDIALNILLLPGVGAMTGDNETEIAQSKGRIIAMQDEFAERCAEEEPDGDEGETTAQANTVY